MSPLPSTSLSSGPASYRVNTVEPHQQLTVETMEQPLPQQHNTMHHPHHPHPQQQPQLNGPDGTPEGENVDPSGDTSQGLPTESQLVLLCLDYLRDLRRAYPAEDLKEVEGLNADYLSVAVYALSRCFTRPTNLVGNNDCMLDPLKQPPLSPRHFLLNFFSQTLNRTLFPPQRLLQLHQGHGRRHARISVQTPHSDALLVHQARGPGKPRLLLQVVPHPNDQARACQHVRGEIDVIL